MIGDETFEETGAGDTNGFYDFLRPQHGGIIGVRFAPFVSHSYLCDSGKEGPGLRISGDYSTAVGFFWEDASDFDNALSADQFFDYNYIFKNSSSGYAVTFGLSHLQKGEIEDILSRLASSGAVE
jgi:hypothetical protein